MAGRQATKRGDTNAITMTSLRTNGRVRGSDSVFACVGGIFMSRGERGNVWDK